MLRPHPEEPADALAEAGVSQDEGGSGPESLLYAATLLAVAVLNGSPVSIGSEGSRDHSFHEPK